MTSTPIHDASPAFGLLLDVDGPIASPVTRTVAIDSIARDLAGMANRGIPVVFNTGRSDAFIAEQVVPRLREFGLLPGTPVFTISEKGAVWAAVEPDGLGEVSIDEELALPPAFGADVAELIRERFADTMFFDHTKRAMVSAEMRVGVGSEEYWAAQKEFDAAIPALIERHGLTGVRIDPTIISTDIESDRLGKDLGARRALELLAARGVEPRSWYTMGDSRTDYAMADWLHGQGRRVTHVDVRPADGVPETDYTVLSHDDEVHDAAGAHFLTRWAADVA
ncbi:hypothetical protein GCM10022377_18420 [Zhihengliuella alba]|uniref:Hydroxymethylpyrimidine pyrophosphatase-like HAD family hydrolase n=1 Tax=Zhihengliuella alba TaxID=547018 RepID=A0ABP7DFM2_9MICC